VPRSIWNGSITFGTVVVPVKVHSATEDRTVHFHEVHEPDGAAIEHKRICPREGKEVPWEEVARGFEVRDGEYVVLEKEELDAAAGTRNRLIDVEHFVDGAAIDPVFYEKTYYLGAREAEDAYRLLHAALQRSGRTAIGRWVFHNREYLVAVRPLDGVLGMHTMHFHDELVDPGEIDVAEPDRKPSKREIEMAASLVDNLHARFKPEKFDDEYRERVLGYLEAKRKGKAPKIEPAKEPEVSDDLLAALQASIDKGKRR
jgi:DNA end-binding protein Ku